MDVPAYVTSHAREFIDPNERIDLSLLLPGAQVSAYLWEELASVGSDLK